MFRTRSWLLLAVMSAAGTSVTAQTTTSLTDAQIAHIAYTAGQIEIAAANLALKNSSNPSVIAFANATLNDYTAANKTALSSLANANINPEDNAISQSLAGAGTEHWQQLSQLSGATFDRAYAQNELAFHILITGALEAKLIPSTQNGPVKNLLQNELALFKQHQDDATQLKSQFK
jgi:putative membrane protein